MGADAVRVINLTQRLPTESPVYKNPHRKKTMTELHQPVAQLYWSLHVDCPKCDERNDISRQVHDSENTISLHIFTNAWDKLEGHEITCEHCGHEFELARVDY
jgi:hypothetical protein